MTSSLDQLELKKYILYKIHFPIIPAQYPGLFFRHGSFLWFNEQHYIEQTKEHDIRLLPLIKSINSLKIADNGINGRWCMSHP
jgi:hypothetical protein